MGILGLKTTIPKIQNPIDRFNNKLENREDQWGGREVARKYYNDGPREKGLEI